MPICNHIAFRVHDLEKTVRFYETILPGKVVARRHGKDLLRSEIAFIEPEGQPGFALVAIQPTRVRWKNITRRATSQNLETTPRRLWRACTKLFDCTKS